MSDNDPHRIAWRDTAAMPRLFGLDVRLLLIAVLPLVSPVAKESLFIGCSAIVLLFTAIDLRFGLGVEDALRWLRARAAGRRRAVSPRRRPVTIRAGYDR